MKTDFSASSTATDDLHRGRGATTSEPEYVQAARYETTETRTIELTELLTVEIP